VKAIYYVLAIYMICRHVLGVKHRSRLVRFFTAGLYAERPFARLRPAEADHIDEEN